MVKNLVVLCGLGGPSSARDVPVFLFNLFYDKRIIPLPKPLRYVLASFISSRRKNKSSAYYDKIGGSSPILHETMKQGYALQQLFDPDDTYVLVAMRHSFPRLGDIVKQVEALRPEKITLIPMYPHFSFTTTLSVMEEWDKVAKKYFPNVQQNVICCHFRDELFIKAQCELIIKEYSKAIEYGQPIIVFTAHSIPVYCVTQGDPYEEQIKVSVENIISRMHEMYSVRANFTISYQSKIGNIKWLEPSTSDVLNSISSHPAVVVPISFSCENLESLFEIDMLYRDEFFDRNLFFRVPALGTFETFILALANMIKSDRKKSCDFSCKSCFYRNCEIENND